MSINELTSLYPKCDYLEVGYDRQHFNHVRARWKTAVDREPIDRHDEHHIYHETPEKFFSYVPNTYDVIMLRDESLIELAKQKLSKKGVICNSGSTVLYSSEKGN